MEATVNPSGSLWRKTAQKTRTPSGTETRKPDAIETPSKNVWIARPTRAEMPTAGFTMRSSWTLLAEVEVRRHRVLEEMDQEVPAEDPERGAWGRGRSDSGIMRRNVADSMKPAPRAMKYLRASSFHRRRETMTSPPTTLAAAATVPKRRLQPKGERESMEGTGG